jgi:hypothetical protein
MSVGDRAVMMVRVQDAIREGLRDPVEIAIQALKTEGYASARYQSLGEVGTVIMDPEASSLTGSRYASAQRRRIPVTADISVDWPE